MDSVSLSQEHTATVKCLDASINKDQIDPLQDCIWLIVEAQDLVTIFSAFSKTCSKYNGTGRTQLANAFTKIKRFD